MYLDTRYKMLLKYLKYVSRYLYLRYFPALVSSPMTFTTSLRVCSQASKTRPQSSLGTYWSKTKFNAKWRFKVKCLEAVGRQ